MPPKVSVYFLNVRSSIDPPSKEIEPFILIFSNSILSFFDLASLLEISKTFSSTSRLGASVVSTTLFYSSLTFFNSCGLGAQKSEYKIITAALRDIAAITFFESI